MVDHLANQISVRGWIPPNINAEASRGFGVLLRRSRGHYVYLPDNIRLLLLEAVQRLNVGVAITIKPHMLEGIIAGLQYGQRELRMKDGSQLQIIDSLASITISSVKKFQFGCLLRKEGMLLVWQDNLQQILSHAQKMEDKLLAYVWGGLPCNLTTPLASTAPSVSNLSMVPPQKGGARVQQELEVYDQSNSSADTLEKDLEDQPESLARPVKVHSAIFIGLGVCLAIVLVFGFSVGQLVSEGFMDGNWTRLVLLACIPLLMMAGMFFFQVIFGNLWQICGPIGGMKNNSRYYSCNKPNMRQAYAMGFSPPHITIQMPVYKEGLETVIMPTVKSLQAAISHYESSGGSAAIFVNDDGMRVMSSEEAAIRKDFYHDNDIGWVARPKHGEEGFIRKGKFKKASNMNFALNISQKVEEYMQVQVDALVAAMGATDSHSETPLDEQGLENIYNECLDRVIRDNPRAQAEGNIRMGEFILIVDSDTRVVSAVFTPILTLNVR